MEGALDDEAGGTEAAETEAALENIVAMVVDTPAAEEKPPKEIDDFWKKPAGASETEDEEAVIAAGAVLSWNACALPPTGIVLVVVPLEIVMVT